MNLGEFRLRIARVTGMAVASTADMVLADAYVNEAVVQFLRETKINLLDGTIAMTAGDADFELPTTVLSLQALWYAPSGSDRVMLEPVSAETLFEMRLPQSASHSNPRFYTVAGAHLIKLFPAPLSSSDVLNYLYVPRPTAMSLTASAPSGTAFGNIPEEYHPYLLEYALWKAASAEEHKGSDNGLQFQAGYERGVTKVRAELARKAGMVMPSVRLGRPREYPRSPGVDVR